MRRAAREALVLYGELDPRDVDKRERTDYHARNTEQLEAGRHPANGTRLRPDLGTCGDCAFHVVRSFGKRYHKCEQHRLGTSRSEASDIRVSWPACELFKASTVPQTVDGDA